MGRILDNVLDVGSLCFRSVRSTNCLTQCWFFWNTTPVTIHWCPPKLIPQIWKYKTPKELFFASHIDAFVVDAGPDFFVFQCYSMATDSFVTYYREILKIHICFTATEGSPSGPIP